MLSVLLRRRRTAGFDDRGDKDLGLGGCIADVSEASDIVSDDEEESEKGTGGGDRAFLAFGNKFLEFLSTTGLSAVSSFFFGAILISLLPFWWSFLLLLLLLLFIPLNHPNPQPRLGFSSGVVTEEAASRDMALQF